MHVLGAWLHTIDPFLLRISGEFGLRWYGLAYLAGFVLAYIQLRVLAARRAVLIPPDRVGDAMMWLVGGVLIGGRLGYVVFYQPSLLWTFTGQAPWWGLLAINEGGMASHGGMIGVIVAAWRVSRGWPPGDGATASPRVPALHVFDAAAIVAPAGLCLGRVANFVNGELLGRIVSPPGVEGPWWSVQFPQELLSDLAPPLTEEQTGRLVALADRVAPASTNMKHSLTMLAHAAGQHAAELKPLLASRHPSQLYQAFAEGPVLAACLWAIWARPRRPGVVGSWFLIAYGVLRVLTERWRLPDPEIGRTLGLSRGQWLSALMILVGSVALGCIRAKGGVAIGGWRRRADAREPT